RRRPCRRCSSPAGDLVRPLACPQPRPHPPMSRAVARRSIRPIALAAALAFAPAAVMAQASAPSPTARAATERVRTVSEHPAVRRALAWLDRNDEAQIAEWIRLTEIPAPSGFEQRRAAYVKAELEKLGLTVTVDSIGNVTAVRRGTGGRPGLVFAAHMDTVHPEQPAVGARRSGASLRRPGIFDNTASVANRLAIARALHATNLQTRGDIVYVATVQEEVGLKGMEYWFENTDVKTDLLV